MTMSVVERFLIKRAAAVAITVVTMLMILFVLEFFREEAIGAESRAWVFHTYEVRGRIHELKARIDEIVVAERGYLIGGHEEYLRSYNEAVQGSEGNDSEVQASGQVHTIKEDLTTLKAMTSDNPVQQKYLYQVDRGIEDLVSHLDSMIDLRKAEGASALQKIDPSRGQQMIDHILDLMNAMIAEENRLLVVRAQTDERDYRYNNIFVLSGLGTFYVVIVLSIWLCLKIERRSKNKLEQSEIYLKTAMNTIIDGLIVIDDKGSIQSFNPAAERLFGYQPDEVIGHNIKMLMPEPYHGEHDGYLHNYMTSGKAKVIGIGREVTAKRKNGSTFPMELGVSEMRVGNRRFFTGTIRDITERKQMETVLRDSEQRYSLAIQGLSVGLWDWNLVNGEIYCSPYFRKIFEMKDTSFIPQLDYFEARFHPDDHDMMMKAIAAHLDRREPFDVEYRLRREDDSYIWVRAKGQALWDDAGKPVRMVGCVEDITDRKKKESEIERYMKALKQSNQELDDFAYIASHDLKEPLRGLVNNAMFLKEDFGDKLDESTIKHLDRMTYLCQRMEKLMNDLLYFSRLGRQDLAIQSTDLNEVIKDIQVMMESTLQEANAVIITPEPLPTITCDLPRVTEVFRNLITNAVKYNKSAQKRIEIGCADLEKLTGGSGKRGTAFYVRDNGIGIPEQFYNDIFRIFKRLNDEDDSVKGTGVGLTFVRKIVERHGGQVWPESRPGNGTTFYFTLNPGKEAQL